jgi:hypothetical protein
VISGERRWEDFRALLDEVEEHAPGLLVVLQPVTPLHGVPAAPRELVLAVTEMAAERELVVRVLPQVHRALGVP